MWDIYNIKVDQKDSNTSYTIAMIDIKKTIIDKPDSYKIRLLCKLLNQDLSNEDSADEI